MDCLSAFSRSLRSLGVFTFKPQCILLQEMCYPFCTSFFSPSFCLSHVWPLPPPSASLLLFLCPQPNPLGFKQVSSYLTYWVGCLKLPEKYTLLQRPSGVVCSSAILGTVYFVTAGLAKSVGLGEGLEENGSHRVSCLLLFSGWIEVLLERRAGGIRW